MIAPGVRASRARWVMILLPVGLYPWLFTVMALPAGALADTLGPRATLTAGAALMALGSVVFGMAPRSAVRRERSLAGA